MAETTKRKRRKADQDIEVEVKQVGGTAWMPSPLVTAFEIMLNLGSPEGIAEFALEMAREGEEGKARRKKTSRFDILWSQLWWAGAAQQTMKALGFTRPYDLARKAARGRLKVTGDAPLAEAATAFVQALDNLFDALKNIQAQQGKRKMLAKSCLASLDKPRREMLRSMKYLVNALAAEGQRTGWQYFRICPAPSRYRLGERCERIFLSMPMGRPGFYCSDACRIRATRAVAAFEGTPSPAE